MLVPKFPRKTGGAFRLASLDRSGLFYPFIAIIGNSIFREKWRRAPGLGVLEFLGMFGFGLTVQEVGEGVPDLPGVIRIVANGANDGFAVRMNCRGKDMFQCPFQFDSPVSVFGTGSGVEFLAIVR
jgi:hypothetical protein